MSSRSCFSIFSGSSALSIRSFTFARSNVETRSKSAMTLLPSLTAKVLRQPKARRSTHSLVGRAVTAFAGLHCLHIAHQLMQIHARESLKEGRHLRRDLR